MSTESPEWWLRVALLFGLIVGIVTWNVFAWVFAYQISESTYQSLFSSVIQGFIGLVAFLGTAVVFQLEEIRERRRGEGAVERATEKEIRRSLTWFVGLIFFDIILSMFFVTLSPLLADYQSWGVIVIAVTIALSTTAFIYAGWIVRRTIFWRE